jgi:hypothetical protein
VSKTYDDRKARGVCVLCEVPAIRSYCPACAKQRRTRQREYHRRRRFDRAGYSSECLCGAAKVWTSECCERCAYLDGTHAIDVEVIAAMRGTDGMSLVDLHHALGRHSSVTSGRRGILRVVQRLEGAGRIRRYWCDGDSRTVTSRMFGREEIERNVGSAGYWVYALDGKTEHEWQRAFIVRWLAVALCWRSACGVGYRRAA